RVSHHRKGGNPRRGFHRRRQRLEPRTGLLQRRPGRDLQRDRPVLPRRQQLGQTPHLVRLRNPLVLPARAPPLRVGLPVLSPPLRGKQRLRVHDWEFLLMPPTSSVAERHGRVCYPEGFLWMVLRDWGRGPNRQLNRPCPPPSDCQCAETPPGESV